LILFSVNLLSSLRESEKIGDIVYQTLNLKFLSDWTLNAKFYTRSHRVFLLFVLHSYLRALKLYNRVKNHISKEGVMPELLQQLDAKLIESEERAKKDIDLILSKFRSSKSKIKTKEGEKPESKTVISLEARITKLKKMRDDAIHSLKEGNPDTPTKAAVQSLHKQLIELLTDVLLFDLPTPPVQFCMIGLGALARGDLSLYMPISFALIVDDINADIHRFFVKMVNIYRAFSPLIVCVSLNYLNFV